MEYILGCLHHVCPCASLERGAQHSLILGAYLEAGIVLLIRGEPGTLSAHGCEILQACQNGAPALGLIFGLPDLLGHLAITSATCTASKLLYNAPTYCAACDSQPLHPTRAKPHWPLLNTGNVVMCCRCVLSTCSALDTTS